MDRGQLYFLQKKIEDRVYLFLCDPSSPIEDVRKALKFFSDEIDLIEMENKKMKEEKPLEPEKSDG